MTKIKDNTEYEVLKSRIEELLDSVDNETPEYDKKLIELNLISNLVTDYEEEYFPVKAPNLTDVIRLRMYEMNLTQQKLSELLGVSPTRISEFLSGKSEPTLRVAREISKKLHIDSSIVLGL